LPQIPRIKNNNQCSYSYTKADQYTRMWHAMQHGGQQIQLDPREAEALGQGVRGEGPAQGAGIHDVDGPGQERRCLMRAARPCDMLCPRRPVREAMSEGLPTATKAQ